MQHIDLKKYNIKNSYYTCKYIQKVWGKIQKKNRNSQFKRFKKGQITYERFILKDSKKDKLHMKDLFIVLIYLQSRKN